MCHGEAQTQFASSDGLSIAYQVVGDGPVDLVLVPGFVSHVELNWEYIFTSRVPPTAPPVLSAGYPEQAGLGPVRPHPRGGHPRGPHGRHPGGHGRRGAGAGRAARRLERRAHRLDLRGDPPGAGVLAGAVRLRLSWGAASPPDFEATLRTRPGVLDHGTSAEQHRPPRSPSVARRSSSLPGWSATTAPPPWLWRSFAAAANLRPFLPMVRPDPPDQPPRRPGHAARAGGLPGGPRRGLPACGDRGGLPLQLAPRRLRRASCG